MIYLILLLFILGMLAWQWLRKDNFKTYDKSVTKFGRVDIRLSCDSLINIMFPTVISLKDLTSTTHRDGYAYKVGVSFIFWTIYLSIDSKHTTWKN